LDQAAGDLCVNEDIAWQAGTEELSVHTLIEKSKALLPKEKTFFELLGFLVLATGIFSGLAILTYDPGDPIRIGAAGETRNMGGPVGAWLAHSLLSTLGIDSLLIAPVLFLCGALIALGFIRWPRPKRFVGFAVVLVVCAGLIHIEHPDLDMTHLPNGLGGAIGTFLGDTLVKSIGYGGAVIGLALVGITTLVITGNLTVSNTAKFAEYLFYLAQRLSSAPETKESRRRVAVLAGPLTTETPAHANGDKRTAHASPVNASDEEEIDVLLDLTSAVPKNAKPDLDMFQTSKANASKNTNFDALAKQLEAQLHEFKIEGKITNTTEGPVVTTLEYEPAAGTKASRIVGIANDIARMLRAQSVRVIPALPGRNTVGIEIPSEQRSIIRFGDIAKSARFRGDELTLPVALGVDTFGNPVIEDLVQMPHLLLAGTTGSGKSVFINNLIAGLVCKKTAKEMRFVFIDPKMVELAAYKHLPHLACPVISDVKTQAKAVLNRLVAEMENRYEMMLALETRNIQEFNETIATRRRSEFVDFNGKWQPLPYVVFLIDEFADLILMLGRPAEELITRLAQKARAAGIHMIIATQRPSVNVVTGLIKANFPTRIAFRVQSGIDSRTILDQVGAETLLGKGDLLYQSAGRLERLHAALLEDKEVRKLVKACA
jgi:S-DNA-T family DNA segregation ATPase FtsK/SpoIIIE